MARTSKPVEESVAPEEKKKPARARKSAKKPIAPEVISSEAIGTVLVANQHTGGVTFPRRSTGGLVAKPLRLAPGAVTEIDADEWAKYRKMPMVQHYMDAGILAEVQREGPVPVLSETTSSLQIPENLNPDGDVMEKGPTAKAGIIRENHSTINIK